MGGTKEDAFSNGGERVFKRVAMHRLKLLSDSVLVINALSPQARSQRMEGTSRVAQGQPTLSIWTVVMLQALIEYS